MAKSLRRTITSAAITALLAIPFSLPSASQERDSGGKVLGASNWREITDTESVVYFARPLPIKKMMSNAAFSDRYQERFFLDPAGIISYSKAYSTGGFNTSRGMKELFNEYWRGDAQLVKDGLAPEPGETRTKSDAVGEWAYAGFERNNRVCFFAKLVFGPSATASSAGNQMVDVGQCLAAGSIAPEALISQWLGTLQGIRSDGPRPGWARAGTPQGARLQPASSSRSNSPTSNPTAGAQLTTASSSAETRAIAVNWDGLSTLLAGTVSIQQERGGGQISIALPNKEGHCRGTYQIGQDQKGTWSIGCSNGLLASGTLVAYGEGKGSSGSGKDTKGRQVQFTIAGN